MLLAEREIEGRIEARGEVRERERGEAEVKTGAAEATLLEPAAQHQGVAGEAELRWRGRAALGAKAQAESGGRFTQSGQLLIGMDPICPARDVRVKEAQCARRAAVVRGREPTDALRRILEEHDKTERSGCARSPGVETASQHVIQLSNSGIHVPSTE